MSATELPEQSSPTGVRLVWVLLFAGSGCAALIYEIVWFQLLQLAIGSTAVSLGILLATYMGGLCAGSLGAPRLVPTRWNPAYVYAIAEAAIGVLGLAVLWMLPALERVYVAGGGSGYWGFVTRGAVCACCLLPPTFLMGATLPILSRWVVRTPRGLSWIGIFYGANIAGAVFGSLSAGFYLLRIHDMDVATYTAAAVNGIVAAIAAGLASKCEFRISDCGMKELPQHHGLPHSAIRNPQAAIYGVIALSGFTALGAEVVWTRLLALLIGGTVYTFSIILAVFLVGLGAGSAVGTMVVRAGRRTVPALAVCQLLLMAAFVWTAVMLAKSLPYWPINPSLSASPWFSFQLDLVRCVWAILPATLLWGASFPIAVAAVAGSGEEPGAVVGKVYAANTLGAVVGALCTSLFLISHAGTQRSQQVFVGVAALAAALMLLTADFEPGRRLAWRWRLVGLPGIALLALVSAGSIPAIPWQLVAHGRYLPTFGSDRKLLYLGEGLNASVAVTEMNDGTRNFHISGKVEASTDPRDMRMQRMLGHLPALFHPHPRSVLVVGCGAGVTAGCFLAYPEVERIVVCELEPLIPARVTPLFGDVNGHVLADPRVRVVYDDARHYILTTRDTFNIITSDPIHPWVRGAATLYTREYFELCARHLNPGGLATQWVPLYESSRPAVQSELATFFQVFSQATVWGNGDNGQGYDTVALGGTGTMRLDLEDLSHRLEHNLAASNSLSAVGFNSGLALLSTYLGRAPDLRPWLEHAQINRDRDLRLQYLAGLSANRYDQNGIDEEMRFYRKYPEGLFTGSEESLAALRFVLRMPGVAEGKPRINTDGHR